MPLNSPTLWVVATPLGNPGDLSPRAREVLGSVDFILAEDTRRAGLLCARCGIEPRRFVSFHDHNEEERLPDVLEALEKGESAALISDAGTPLCADPGYRLIRACRKAGFRVSPVPGPSAVLAALSAAGLPPQPFAFFGFLPRRQQDVARLLAPCASLALTLVFFERKNRLGPTLATAARVLGSRECCIARELTKPHEEFILFDLDAPPEELKDVLGECTIIVGPPREGARTPQAEVEALARVQFECGLKPREQARAVHARIQGWTLKEIYDLLKRGKAAS